MPKTKPERTEQRISVRWTEADAKRVRAEAKRRKMKVSDFVRTAVLTNCKGGKKK